MKLKVVKKVFAPISGIILLCIHWALWNIYIIYIIWNIYIIYIYIYIYIFNHEQWWTKLSKEHNISSNKWSTTLFKSHRSKMVVIYIQSWKQCRAYCFHDYIYIMPIMLSCLCAIWALCVSCTYMLHICIYINIYMCRVYIYVFI